jgi:MFS family permease
MSQLASLWQLYLYFGTLVGIASSLMTPLLSLIPRWFSSSRTVMAGIISAGGGVGGLFMPLVANWLMINSSWQRAYLIMGIAYLVVVLIAVQFLRYKPAVESVGSRGAATNVKGTVPVFSLREAVKSRNYWLMAAMVSVFGYVANVINLHSAPHATDIGLSSTAAAALLSIMNGASIVGCIVLGLLGDRIGNQKMLVATFAIEAAVFFWLASITDLWMLNAFMIIYGVAFGSGLAQTAPLVARLFGTRSLGVILGTITFTQTVAAGLGGWVSGAIYDTSQSYYWAFLTCGILGTLAVAATLSVRLETVKKSSAAVRGGK